MNAASPLFIIAPDGSNQVVHPDIIYVPEGYLGFEYWMACTPYPFAADKEENPIIRVSHDGVNWQKFIGAPDPLVNAPTDYDWHHADTELVLHNGILRVFYITTNSVVAGTQFSYLETTDGVRWTEPKIIYENKWGVSPTFIVNEKDEWLMWYVHRDSLADEQSSKLFCRTGATPDAFGEDFECILKISDHVVWHIDVALNCGVYIALVAAFPVGADPSRCRLFHALSNNGIDFKLTQSNPILRPSWFRWDNRMIYRSTFLPMAGGKLRIWYSAASWGMRTGIGLVEGPPSCLRSVVYSSPNVSLKRKVMEDVVGLVKYLIYRILPSNIFLLLLKFRRKLIDRLSAR
jgi:hypothetical protein